MKDNPLKIIRNGQEFEKLCCSIAQFKYGDFDAQRYGRRGQKQWGVDIRAINKKSKDEKIVIQCKFRTNPLEFKSNKFPIKAIKKEIENELSQAIKGNPFDCFIYASNTPRDTHLQDFADTLCTDSYKIIIWSQDDIEEDIYKYERLKQIYTLNGMKHGVEIINTDFIDTLEFEEKKLKPNIFRYYTSSEKNNNQWYGTLKNWDVKRDDHSNFIKSVFYNLKLTHYYYLKLTHPFDLKKLNKPYPVFLALLCLTRLLLKKDHQISLSKNQNLYWSL